MVTRKYYMPEFYLRPFSFFSIIIARQVYIITKITVRHNIIACKNIEINVKNIYIV